MQQKGTTKTEKWAGRTIQTQELECVNEGQTTSMQKTDKAVYAGSSV